MAKLQPDEYDISYFDGKKVLEIGCAKRYIVHNLRDFEVDAYKWKRE